MQRLILSALVVALTGGVASADHWRDNRRDNRTPVVVRDHRNDNYRSPTVRVEPTRRWDNGRRYDDRRYDDRRWENRYSRRVVDRRPVYVNNNVYRFHNGYQWTYHRPVIARRYFDYRYRPTVLVENYSTVPGYIWIAGRWDWNGYEWLWVSGHYDVDPAYQYYDDGGYSYNGSYYPASTSNYYAPAYNQPCD